MENPGQFWVEINIETIGCPVAPWKGASQHQQQSMCDKGHPSENEDNSVDKSDGRVVGTSVFVGRAHGPSLRRLG